MNNVDLERIGYNLAALGDAIRSAGFVIFLGGLCIALAILWKGRKP